MRIITIDFDVKYIDISKALHLTVLHNATLPEAEELADRVQREYAPKEMFISIVSPVLGVHTGPGCVGAVCGPLDVLDE